MNLAANANAALYASMIVYTLNTDEMTQVAKDDGSPALIRLKPGQTYEIPGDRGTVTFDSVKRLSLIHI